MRAAKEWSQSDLADKLGVSRQTIDAIETEKYDPSLPLAFKVARLFKLPIENTFFLWGRHLGVAPSVIFGALLLIEGLGGVIVSRVMERAGMPLSKIAGVWYGFS